MNQYASAGKTKVTSLLSIQEITDRSMGSTEMADKYYQLAKGLASTYYTVSKNLERLTGRCSSFAMNCALRSQLRYLAFSSGIPQKKHKEMQTELTSFCTDHPAYLGVLAYDEPAEQSSIAGKNWLPYYQAVLPDKLFTPICFRIVQKVTQIKKHKQDESGRYYHSRIQEISETFIQS